MEYRRLGRLGHESSVLIYGAASLGAVSQDVADASVAEALAAGINHIDVAASYGDAELRLGAMMDDLRPRVFLATKTGDRDAEGAWASINRSLERLRTDRIDLIQLHEVGQQETLDEVTRTGGALEALVRARDEGLVRGIGITGHHHTAPATHAEALRRFDFDTVLTPLNRRLWRVTGYADDFAALAEMTQARDVGLMTIKMIARRPWPDDERELATWYEPFTEQQLITASLAWLLNGHPEVTGLATAGETRLLGRVIAGERARVGLSAEDAAATLDALPASEYVSVYDG